jgi:hypothetical protein
MTSVIDVEEIFLDMNINIVYKWLKGELVYFNGVAYVFPHGVEHIRKIVRQKGL